MSAPADLPRFAQDFTAEQRAAVVTWLSSLSLAELRIRQDVNRVQFNHALRSPHTCARGTAESLQLRAEILADAVEIKLLANMSDSGLTVKTEES